MSASSTDDQIKAIKAVDVHGHSGTYYRAEMPDYYTRAPTSDAACVTGRGRRAGIEWTVVSPIPRCILPPPDGTASTWRKYPPRRGK
jgi:hypothetical protein